MHGEHGGRLWTVGDVAHCPHVEEPFCRCFGTVKSLSDVRQHLERVLPVCTSDFADLTETLIFLFSRSPPLLPIGRICFGPSTDGRRVTRLVNTIKPDKNESRVYSSDEHGFRLTVPKETSTDGGRSCGPPEPAAGPILLEHTSIVVRCGPHAFLVTSVVHCLPYDASLTKPIILDFAGDVDSTALGQYKVRIRGGVGINIVMYTCPHH